MLNRRTFNIGLGGSIAAASLVSGPLGGSALAQQSGLAKTWQEFSAIVTEARRLGLAAPRIDGIERRPEDALPAISDLVDMLQRSAGTDVTSTPEIEAVLDRAAELLRATVAGEAAPSEGRGLSAAPRIGRQATAVATRPKYEDLKADYEELFRTATIRSQYRSTVVWYANKLKDPTNQARYKKVSEAVCAPWFFIGITHAMEAGFNFLGHLHNGDSLKAKTVNVPKGRPPAWNPPNDWESSAIDAIQFDKLANIEDWSLPAMLYNWERYNGFRSRTIQKINTPYLWSFSNHYTKGKYVADNVWDPNAVSRQCGAAVMLKVLIDEGLVTVPNV